MVEELASRWVDYVIENGADKEQRAVYVYGLICFINELFSSVLLLAIALPLNRIWQIVVWMMAFDMFRLNIMRIPLSGVLSKARLLEFFVPWPIHFG